MKTFKPGRAEALSSPQQRLRIDREVGVHSAHLANDGCPGPQRDIGV
jgi:hypothetical protein